MLKIVLIVWLVVVCINIGFETLEDRKRWPLYGAYDWIFTGLMVLSGPIVWAFALYCWLKGYIWEGPKWGKIKKG